MTSRTIVWNASEPEDELGKAVATAGLFMLGLLRQAPTPRDTGNLRSSYMMTRLPTYVRVGTHVDYAPFQEYGPRPHFRIALQKTMGKYGGHAG